MDLLRALQVGCLVLMVQILWCGCVQSEPCSTGFESDQVLFNVQNRHLRKGVRLGRVVFKVCDEKTLLNFISVDRRFQVHRDGMVVVNRPVTLHVGGIMFTVQALDSTHKQHSVEVTVALRGQLTEVDQMDSQALLQSSGGLTRKKREMNIPPLRLPENGRGPFPMLIAQLRSSKAEIEYSITGEGADQPPVGLFTINKNNGAISVTKSLDRESKAKYVLQVHGHSVGGDVVEPPQEITISVTDQNDNSPVFTQRRYAASVSQTATKGTDILKVTATDADDPATYNAEIRYSIVIQTPPLPQPDMFAINPITGMIYLNSEGLDSEKQLTYILNIQAADMEGNGIRTTGTAVILVTPDGESHAESELVMIPQIMVPENDRGPFPKRIAQLMSGNAKDKKMAYSISGHGANQPPVGLFTVDKETGWISVTKPLDREVKDKYEVQAHAVAAGGETIDTPLNFNIYVIDQNDNKPKFTQDTFQASVADDSKPGTIVTTVTATDADDPHTANADIRYTIISQDPALPQPDMFRIDPTTGVIQVNSDGLNHENHPQYTLEIGAADMQGQCLSDKAKAVITVISSRP